MQHPVGFIQIKDLAMIKRITFFLILFLLVTGCNNQTESPQPPPPTGTEPLPEPEKTVSLTDTEEAEAPNQVGLSPDPIQVSFSSKDGVELQGIFFPAGQDAQPVIVLMHWYPGDQTEWTEIAYWLQNRGQQGELNGVPWKDPSWFPGLKPSVTFNVLTFTFRDCEGGCQGFNQSGWLMDAKAALEFARSLDGVDPNRVIAIGASIGADGAIDGCAAVLKDDPKSCLGALSFSPGSYLDKSYPEMVEVLSTADPSRPAWCLYDENDPDSAFCKDIHSDNYYQESWRGGNLHGMHLITPNLDPRPLERILAFLDLVVKRQE
jgi:dienelactone hydrolase